jgi:hypothetical protein
MANDPLMNRINKIDRQIAAGADPNAVAARYERRVCSRPDIVDEIKNTYSGLVLPAGPSGMVGLERELRRYFTSAAPGLVAKLLYRALCHEQHRVNAEWYIDNQTKEELGLVTYEHEQLKKVAALPIPKRMKRGQKRLLQAYVTDAQFDWLQALSPEANMSENLRAVLDAAMGVCE